MKRQQQPSYRQGSNPTPTGFPERWKLLESPHNTKDTMEEDSPQEEKPVYHASIPEYRIFIYHYILFTIIALVIGAQGFDFVSSFSIAAVLTMTSLAFLLWPSA